MVSHHHRVNPVTRRDNTRRINRRRDTPARVIRNRLRILTPREINQQFDDSQRFLIIDVEPRTEITIIPFERNPPSYIHGPGSPTPDIIEYPLQPSLEEPTPSTSFTPDNISTPAPVALISTDPEEGVSSIFLSDIENFEQINITDSLAIDETDDINPNDVLYTGNLQPELNPLLTSEDYDPVYDPVDPDQQLNTFLNEIEEPTFSQILHEVLNDEFNFS